MTLPAKTLLLLGAVIAAMVIWINLAGRSLFLQPFSQWEEEEARLNMRRYLGAIHTCLVDFANAAAAWAGDAEVIGALTAPARQTAMDLNALLESRRLDWLILLAAQPDAAAEKALFNGKKYLPPSLVISSLRAALPKMAGGERAPRRGIFACGNQMFLFAAAPLTAGEGGEKPASVLAVGRSLDIMEIDRLSQLMYLSCTFQRLDDRLPASPDNAAGSEGAIGINVLNRNLLNVFTTLAAVDGRPLALLRAVYPRRIYLRGAIAADHLTLILIVAALSLALVILGLLERLLIARFLALENAVRQVRDNLLPPSSLCSAGQDEISALANDVADLAASLRRSEQELRTARDSLDDEVHRRTAELARANARLEAEMAERLRLAEDLRHAQKVEAIGTLAAGLVHEISQPLHAFGLTLAVLSRLLASSTPTPAEEIKNRCGRLRARCEQIASIVAQMRSFIEGEGAPLQKVETAEAVAAAAALLQPLLAEHGIALRFAAESNLPPALANRTQIMQVATNLITNAAEALDAVRRQEKIIAVSLRAEGGAICLTVDDNGPGIGDTKERMFDPFFTTKEPGKGMGLGLTLVHFFVSSWGGETVAADSPLGGARLLVKLPLAAAEEKHEYPRG